jgi:2',3'-cyclic-nucleotide 2'-phosphodiesterase (5'-nucleotidase family)
VNSRGIRVAILGMANISSLNSIVDGGNSLQAVPLEQNETARAYVQLLMPVADLVVVVSHLGLTEDQDLITGYDAYFPLENARPFMTRKENPWRQIEPDPATCVSGKPCTFLDGTVRVFIPGVSGIDVIEGGHLHVVLNPPQVLRDPSGRQVIISHSGAFSKYLGRLDLQVELPPAPPPSTASEEALTAYEARRALGAEVIAHDYRVFPVDGVWCDDEARSWRAKVQPDQYARLIHDRPKTEDCRKRFYDALPPSLVERCFADYDRDFRTYGCDQFLPLDCRSRVEQCAAKEDRPSTHLLQPYVMGLDNALALPRIFAFAPKDIARRNNSTGGDSPLGNMTAESMRVRKRVEAEFSLTNTLGIRDNLYAGPITLESMFNVFPFENTINIMYLSGLELQELTDFVASRSSERGCQSQAQVSGIKFTMDCDQAIKNQQRYPCEKDTDCDTHGTPENRSGWQCTAEKVCWAHPSFGHTVANKAIDPNASYKIAVNDYIARGGSGFRVLKRNTTRIETGISLRDSLIDWMRGQCTCEEILKPGDDTKKRSSAGFACATSHDGKAMVVDPIVTSYCKTAHDFETAYSGWVKAGQKDRLAGAPALFAGKCNCQEAINVDEKACGHVTVELKNFCRAPTRVPIAVGEEDGRIGRRVR